MSSSIAKRKKHKNMNQKNDNKKNVAINGFGRIGRLLLRAYLQRSTLPFSIVAINDLGRGEDLVHLLRYDSVHGRLQDTLTFDNGQIKTSKGTITLMQESEPSRLPWREQAIDIVLECSGRFTSRTKAMAHIKSGAQHVLVSAPCSEADKTIVYGINHDSLEPTHQIISNASCTTNCLVPIVDVLFRHGFFHSGYMTTVHSYTGDQSTVDMWHKDLRRARAAALSMIPTTSGAARAVALVLPQLKGKIDGCAVRVPTANVSLIDLTFTSDKPLSSAAVNDAMRQAAETDALKGILVVNDAPLVSMDFNHHPASSIFDATQTQIIAEHFGRVVAWYDNEWGFSNRMVDSTAALATMLAS